jgi:hypothetical protein
MGPRKTLFIKEVVHAEAGSAAARPVLRMAVADGRRAHPRGGKGRAAS